MQDVVLLVALPRHPGRNRGFVFHALEGKNEVKGPSSPQNAPQKLVVPRRCHEDADFPDIPTVLNVGRVPQLDSATGTCPTKQNKPAHA
eukprot:scaffold41_cov274-Pinguiococcus_pyrenoidosus.AAC.3